MAIKKTQVFAGSRSFVAPPKPIIMMGVFDGVHLGHQALCHETVLQAHQNKATPVAYTFDPHPVKILAPQACPIMINTVPQRIQLLGQHGIKMVVVENFTKKFSQMTPEQFFKKIICDRLKASEILVGYNFTFGVKRSGNVNRLQEMGAKAGIQVHIIRPFMDREVLVSSSHIRHLLQKAHLEGAQELLRRPYFMEGTVIRGRGIGGKVLKIHTANLKPDNDLILPNGVYVTQTDIGTRRYQSLTNMGHNPTFGWTPQSIETHILKMQGSLVGKKIRVHFLKKIREEMSFSSPEDLQRQIHHDIQWALSFFKTYAS